MSKVKIGAKYPCFAPIATEPESELPTYSTPITVIGELISSNLTITLATGELYSDDALNISVSDFVSGQVAMTTDGLDDEAAEGIYGATIEEEGSLVKYNVGDEAPYGGLAYYCQMKSKAGGTYYKGYFFPKVQAAMGNDNSSTKGSSVTFSTNNTNFTVMKANNGDWMHTEVLDSEAAAKAWVTSVLTTQSGGGG